MLLIAGVGALSAAIPIPQAGADSRLPHAPAAPPPAAPQGAYIFHDEFDGVAGSTPDPSKWTVARAREPMKDPTFWERPENVGQYRDDRQNVFVDGKSNLVLRAAKDGNTYYSGKVQSPWHGGIGHTWETRIKLNCLTAGCWPAWWLGNEDNGGRSTRSSGTATAAGPRRPRCTPEPTVPSGQRITSPWIVRGTRGGANGMKLASASGRTTSDGAAPYFNVPANSIGDWPFNNPGYQVFPVFNLAVAGSGGGDPRPGTYPAEMLVDYIRVW